MRVCFFGTYERDYVSNRMLMDGLRRAGWQILECHVPIWEKERNKTGRYLGVVSLTLRGVEVALAYMRLVLRYVFLIRSCDVLMVGYIGHLDMPLAWLLSRLPRRPLVFCPLISLYDTLIFDRKAFSEHSLMSRFLRWLDRWTCLHADLVALDTHTHIRYFVDTFGIPRDKFVRIFVGAPEQKPVPRLRPANEPFRVVFQGKFTPLHGLEFMIEAASLLKDDPSIRFHFVGSGQRSEKIRGLAVERGLQNVEFTGWIESDRIPEFVAGMDLCLGIFGTSAKAGRVIPTKVFLALSLGKPVITGDTPAIRELLTDGESVALCPPGDPLALAQRIVQLSRDESLLNHIAGQGHRVFLEQASETRIGQSMADALHRLKPQRR